MGSLPIAFQVSHQSLGEHDRKMFEVLITSLSLHAIEALSRARLESENTILADLSTLANTSTSREYFLQDAVEIITESRIIE
jgi:predicted signal transduction protein with EAL and GGDEF domain